MSFISNCLEKSSPKYFPSNSTSLWCLEKVLQNMFCLLQEIFWTRKMFPSSIIKVDIFSKVKLLHHKSDMNILYISLLLLLCTYCMIPNVNCEWNHEKSIGSGGGYYIKLFDFKKVCPLHSFCAPWNFVSRASK